MKKIQIAHNCGDPLHHLWPTTCKERETKAKKPNVRNNNNKSKSNNNNHNKNSNNSNKINRVLQTSSTNNSDMKNKSENMFEAEHFGANRRLYENNRKTNRKQIKVIGN